MTLRILYLIIALVTLLASAPPSGKLMPEKKIRLKIPEPSDICISHDGQSFFIVSDNGFLFETDFEGNIKQKATFQGMDFEGVYADKDFVYVSDESLRKIHFFSVNGLELVRTVSLQYSGGRNKGFESLTFHPVKEMFVLATEKDPIWIREYDLDFILKNEVKFKGVRDISALTWHKNHLWALSDEDRKLLKLDGNSYQIVESWIIPVINPEGLAFSNGKLYILSDDLETLFVFPDPDQ